jgi:hypothetical protein
MQPEARVYLKPAPQVLDMSQELLYAKAEILKQKALVGELQGMVTTLSTTVEELKTSLLTLSSSLHAVATSGSYSDLKDKAVNLNGILERHIALFMYAHNVCVAFIALISSDLQNRN